MYSRQEIGGRYPRVPQNYSGNAFREETVAAEEAPPKKEASEGSEAQVSEAEATEAVARAPSVPPLGFRLDLGRLFRSGGGGIGFEELLILGLILLLSQSDTKDDLILLLVLLLFIQ